MYFIKRTHVFYAGLLQNFPRQITNETGTRTKHDDDFCCCFFCFFFYYSSCCFWLCVCV